VIGFESLINPVDLRDTRSLHRQVITEKSIHDRVLLLIIKENVDDAYFCNQAIVENAEYFKKNILTYVTRCFKDADISTDREARKYVSEVINREYQTAR